MLWDYVYIGSQVVCSFMLDLCQTAPIHESGESTVRRANHPTKRTRRKTHTRSTTSNSKDTPENLRAHEEPGELGLLLALEPRIMFDGAALASGAEVVHDQITQGLAIPDQEFAEHDTETEAFSDPFTNSIDLFSALSTATTPSDRREIIFIDTSVEDYQTLLLGIDPHAEAILLDSTRDGIEQIAEILGGRTDIDAVHIISHGNQGELRLGSGVLNLASMQGEYADELAIINQSLTEEADFLIYGCNFGEGEIGQEAANLLAELTGTDVAASVNDTGNAQYGADWDLEYQTGTIEAQVAVSAETQEAWIGKLAVFTVDTFADVVNAGDGLTSLREAIIAVNAGSGGDTINLAAGTYTLSIAGTGEDAGATGDLDINKDVTISGAGAGTTIIDGNSIDRVFHIKGTSNTASISGVTIQGGDQSNGGGIFVDNTSTLNLSGATLTGNNHSGAGSGGAIHVHGTAHLNDVLLSGNTADDGGAIGFHGADGGSLTNVTISGNSTTGKGGGIWNDSVITVINSTITGNMANSDEGGGVYNTGTITLTDTTISGNSATWGGGINNTNNLTLERVTIDGNTSSNNGGGIYNFAGNTVSLTNVTISGNTSGNNGGGIFTTSSIDITNSTIASNLGGGGIHTVGSGDARLKNTILDNNVGGNANRALTSLGNNIDSDSTAGLGDPLDGVNPMLAALADNGGPTRTHALLGGSQAINGGTATGAPALDQRGVNRDGSVDIGAYEFTGNSTPTLDLDLDDSSGATGNDYNPPLPFTEGDGPTAIADTDTALVDADLGTFASVKLGISALLDGNAEVLILDGSTFALATAVASQNTMGGLYHVVLAPSGVAASLIITKAGGGTFTDPETETLIKAIRYQHTDTSSPTNGNRLIDVIVNDGTQDSAAARTTININPVNDPPVALADSITVNEGSTTILNLSANDSDADDGLDLTSITILAGPANGTIDSINADGTVTYTHNGSETLSDSFTYTIDDPSGVTSNTVTVSLTVTPQNDSPLAVANSFTVNESSTNTLNLSGNDSDVDDGLDLTSIAIITGPTNGTITSINTNGTVEYTHNGSETVVDSFTYTINDLAGATSNTATVNLTVTPQNDAPTIISDGGGANANVSVLTGNTAVTTVNATDAEGALLTYSIIGGVDASLFSIDPTTGSLTFQTAPNVQTPGDVGGDNIYDVIVQASDGTLTDTQAIAITVADLPVVVLPPTADPPSESPSESGEEDAGESEDEVSGNVLLAGSNPQGHGSGGNQNSTGENPNDSNQLNHLAKDNVALMEQLREGNGIKGTAGDLMGLFQQSFERTTLKSEIASLLGTSSGFLKDLDEARDALNDVVATEKTYVASSIAASTGLSVGYVFWLLRSGVLLTALLSSVPAWQFVNPLLVLDSPTKKKRRKSQEDPEDDSVESMFENHTEPTQTSQSKTEKNPKSH